MAKVKFEREKPHLNTGSNAQSVEDTSGRLTVTDVSSDATGNPAPSSSISFSAPASSNSESATVAFPIDAEFQFDPSLNAPAESIDLFLDVMPTAVSGTNEVDISLAILQDSNYFLSRHSSPPSIDGTETDWTRLEIQNIQQSDFRAVDGSNAVPDFAAPFQFGFGFSSEYAAENLSVDLAVDNMWVQITLVPEPVSSFMFMIIGAAVLCRRLLFPQRRRS